MFKQVEQRLYTLQVVSYCSTPPPPTKLVARAAPNLLIPRGKVVELGRGDREQRLLLHPGLAARVAALVLHLLGSLLSLLHRLFRRVRVLTTQPAIIR